MSKPSYLARPQHSKSPAMKNIAQAEGKDKFYNPKAKAERRHREKVFNTSIIKRKMAKKIK